LWDRPKKTKKYRSKRDLPDLDELHVVGVEDVVAKIHNSELFIPTLGGGGGGEHGWGWMG
jgi:hypothetical protein